MAVRFRTLGATAWFMTVLPLLVAGCGQTEDQSSPPPVATPGPQAGTPTGTAAQSGARPTAYGSKDKDNIEYYGKGTTTPRPSRPAAIPGSCGPAVTRTSSAWGRRWPAFRHPGRVFPPARLANARAVSNDSAWSTSRTSARPPSPINMASGSTEWLGDDTYPDTKRLWRSPTGIVGLRKFPQPQLRQVRRWNVRCQYFRKPEHDRAPLPGRHDLRLLPHGIPPPEPSRRS